MKNLFLITALTAAFTFTSCENENDSALENDTQRVATAIANVKSIANVHGSVWTISSFVDDGRDETALFQGYTFEFLENDMFLVTTPDGMTLNGRWKVERDDDNDDEADDDGDDDFYDDVEFDIVISGNDIISLINDDHEVFAISDNEINLSDDDDDDDNERINVNELPQAAQNYLTQNFAGVQVCYVEVEEDDDEDYKYEVQLINGLELYFNSTGDLVDQEMSDDRGCDDTNDIDRIIFTRVS